MFPSILEKFTLPTWVNYNYNRFNGIERVNRPARGGYGHYILLQKAARWILTLRTRILSGLNHRCDVNLFFN